MDRTKRQKIDFSTYYYDYIFRRKTLAEIADTLSVSSKTLLKYFDQLPHHFDIPPAPKEAIHLILDATFFGRKFGYFCCHDGKRIIYAKEIKTESIKVFRECLQTLSDAGYHFASFTLDGRLGFISAIKKRFPNALVQMCHFHQKAIIRRYITDNPKSECGQELKQLMHTLSGGNAQAFINDFFALKDKYRLFLLEKNEQGTYVHRRLRSAFRSLKTNLPYLFIYQETRLSIPNTTNRLEGAFSHLKERINIHRGMAEIRKKQAIIFCLKQLK